MTPEAKAQVCIDALLLQVGWHVSNMAGANIRAAADVIEAKKEGATLTGVEVQSAHYAQGQPSTLPILFESTGVETHFTNGLDLQPSASHVFSLFRQP